MREILLLVLLAALPQLSTDRPVDAEPLFQNGKTWEQFLSGISAQRELWTKQNPA